MSATAAHGHVASAGCPPAKANRKRHASNRAGAVDVPAPALADRPPVPSADSSVIAGRQTCGADRTMSLRRFDRTRLLVRSTGSTN